MYNTQYSGVARFNGEAISFTREAMRAINLNLNDTVKWGRYSNDTVYFEKVNTRLVEVQVLDIFKSKYILEIPQDDSEFIENIDFSDLEPIEVQAITSHILKISDTDETSDYVRLCDIDPEVYSRVTYEDSM